MRRRILRAIVGWGLLETCDAKGMLAYQHSGFSVDSGALANPKRARRKGRGYKRSPAHYLWAVLIARTYEVLPLLCPLCGGQMRLIAVITAGTQIRKTLDHIGVDSEPPHIFPAHG